MEAMNLSDTSMAEQNTGVRFLCIDSHQLY